MPSEPRRETGRTLRLAALGIVALASWSLGIYFRLVPPAHSGAASSGAAADTSSAAQTADHSAASAGPSSAPEALSSGSAAAAGTDGGTAPGLGSSEAPSETQGSDAGAPQSGELEAADEARVTACVSGDFPQKTFERATPAFGFVCVDGFPLRGVTRVQSQVALGRWGKGGMTAGMQQWAELGWYQIAAYAVFRGQCCASPPRYEWTFKLDCPMEAALEKVEQAARAHDAAALGKAAEQFDQAASCLTKLGQAPLYGQTDLPKKGARAFHKLLERVRAAAP